MLARYGIHLGDFMDFVDVAFAGESLGQVFEGQRSFDLVVRYNEQNRKHCLCHSKTLYWIHLTERKIPLHYVATVDITGNPYSIKSGKNVQT